MGTFVQKCLDFRGSLEAAKYYVQGKYVLTKYVVCIPGRGMYVTTTALYPRGA